MSAAPRAENADVSDRLTVGERGYYREHGKIWPARVLANDVEQTFGRIDAIIAVAKWPGHECTTRLVRKWNSVTSGHWVSIEQFVAEERQRIAEEACALQARLAKLLRDATS